MKRIKSVGVFSAAKFGGALLGCIQLIVMSVSWLLGTVAIHVPGHLDPEANWLGSATWHIGHGATMIVAVALFSLGYAFLGFVTGACAAIVYNLVAKRFGGIEVELEPLPELQIAERASSVNS
jgi:hypothetical protein